MRNRWFHRPELHSPAPGEERRVGWIELFYDLVYVATIIQLGSALSKHPDWGGFLIFSGLFAAIWYAWSGFTFFSNRFVVDDALHRLLVFVKMFGIAAIAVLAPEVFKGETQSFALAYVLVRLVIVALYVRAWLQVPGVKTLSRAFALRFAVGAAFWFASVFVEAPWVWVLWVVGLSIEITAPVSAKLRELTITHPPDAAHLAERYGLLTIIVLGESFVKVLTDLAEGEASAGWGTAGLGGLALLITCSVWWIYFDDVVHSRIRRRAGARFLWIYAHLPLAIGITALGVGIKKAVGADPDVSFEAARWLLTGSLALVYLSVALLDWVTERDMSRLDDMARVWMRVGSAVAVLSVGLVGDLISNWVSLCLIAVLCVAQVIADLAIAPQGESHVDADHLQSAFGFGEMEEDLARREADRRRRDPLEAVRRGTPSNLRRGIYFFFMEGGWTRLLSAVVFVYLLVCLVFAVLYTLDRGGVDNADPQSFADAFFFSVQTFSTIGFGTLSPASPTANTLVVVQAILALIFAAMVTGMVFAKASRPQASMLYTRNVIVGTFEGEPALMLRVGNARGNEVVEATVRLTALCEESGPDGQQMRRVRDLKLVRSVQPLFSLTWLIIHPLDEDSPLVGITEETAEERLLALIATMTGYDGTYAQTTHSRYMWYPEDLVFGHRFVDVLSTLDDGRLSVDYRKFHQTQPVEHGA